jgi:glycolate oxidase iron-sulfur subunit
MHLVDQARAHIERTYKRPLLDRLIRRALAATLPYPRRFRAAAGEQGFAGDAAFVLAVGETRAF